MVILNGNKSLDDHAITTWEWTKEKTSDGSELPADIVGARTPYLKVSNLEQVNISILWELEHHIFKFQTQKRYKYL